MAVGGSSTPLLGGLSYVAVGKETTTGTYNTCTAGLDFRSTSIKTQKDSKILEQIERSRTYSKRLSLGKTVGGDIEWYFRPLETADGFILQNVFGGTVTTSTFTSETTGGGALDHVFSVGNFDQSWPSLCLNIRKEPGTTGRIFEYSGVRVNELTISGEIDEPLMCAVNVIGMDSTQNSNDIESVLTTTANEVLSFVNGRLSVETTFAGLTATSFWHIQSFEFKLNNNLKGGNESRRIGSDILDVLPAGMQTYQLSAQIRFDTTTAYDAMIAGTEYSAEVEFLGNTISGSIARQGLLVEFQKVQIKEAGDPEISGPDGILTSQVVFDVLRDESATGYAVQATLTNDITSYA